MRARRSCSYSFFSGLLCAPCTLRAVLSCSVCVSEVWGFCFHSPVSPRSHNAHTCACLVSLSPIAPGIYCNMSCVGVCAPSVFPDPFTGAGVGMAACPPCCPVYSFVFRACLFFSSCCLFRGGHRTVLAVWPALDSAFRVYAGASIRLQDTFEL